MSLPSDTADQLATALGNDVLTEIIALFKDRWSHISEADKNAAWNVCRRFAELTILEKTGNDVYANLIILDATISNWKAAGQIELYDATNEALKRVVSLLGTFAGKLIRGFVGI